MIRSMNNLFSYPENRVSDFFHEHSSLIASNRNSKKPYHEGLPLSAKSISLDSLVACDIETGEKSLISKSTVGRSVKIGNGTKISNSVILGNVEIGPNTIIQNCLIFSKAKIGENCKLKGQFIEGGQIIDSKTTLLGDGATD
jgi:ADP-glucose pyrophosphorylase